MIDNVTLVRNCKSIPNQYWENERPFEERGLLFSPKFKNGQLVRFEASLRNLRLYVYPEKVILMNSIHKFWHRYNFNDFHFSEIKLAIESISEKTGIDWELSEIKKIEYGANILANAQSIFNSMLSYKGKDFHFMVSNNGKKYGARNDFEQYRLKAYDKAFETSKTERLNLKFPLFRWEIQVKDASYLSRLKLPGPNKFLNLMDKGFLQKLANDSISIYQNIIKMKTINLYKLSSHQKRVLAVMTNPIIKEEFKIHNKETFKRDQRIFREFMNDKSICVNDETSQLLKEKFRQLIDA